MEHYRKYIQSWFDNGCDSKSTMLFKVVFGNDACLIKLIPVDNEYYCTFYAISPGFEAVACRGYIDFGKVSFDCSDVDESQVREFLIAYFEQQGFVPPSGIQQSLF